MRQVRKRCPPPPRVILTGRLALEVVSRCRSVSVVHQTFVQCFHPLDHNIFNFLQLFFEVVDMKRLEVKLAFSCESF